MNYARYANPFLNFFGKKNIYVETRSGRQVAGPFRSMRQARKEALRLKGTSSREYALIEVVDGVRGQSGGYI